MASLDLSGVPKWKLAAICSVGTIPMANLIGYIVYIQYNRPHVADDAAGFVHPFALKGDGVLYLSQLDQLVIGALFVLTLLCASAELFFILRLARRSGGAK